jgi:hypothetical protein
MESKKKSNFIKTRQRGKTLSGLKKIELDQPNVAPGENNILINQSLLTRLKTLSSP